MTFTDLSIRAYVHLAARAPLPSPTAEAPAPTTPDVGFDTSGAVTLVVKNVVPLLLVFLGILFIGRSARGRMSDVTTSSAIAIWGIAFIAGAGVFYGLGDDIVNAFTSK
jgi:hypothetical protein